MKIIVAQRHYQNTDGIKNDVAQKDPQRAEEIIFVNSAEEVVENIQSEEPTLIVSGQVFGSGVYGTILARIVKKMNPSAVFFIYSTDPERNEAVDGVIPKSWGTASSRTGMHPLLASILTSRLEDMTASRLKELFPQIG